MSETEKTEPPSGWARTAAVLGVAVVAAATLAYVAIELANNNQSFEIVVDRNAGVTIKAQAGDGIETLIDSAFKESAASVGGVLAERGFYKLHSDNLITALELSDPGKIPPSTLRQYRRLLGEFEGPFRLPGTLLESDARLLLAIEDLEKQVRKSRQTNHLIAALWQQSLDQQGIFRPRLLKARIVVITGPVNENPQETPDFFTCPGNPIKDRLITIGAPSDSDGNLLPATSQKIDGVIRDDPFMSQQLGCGEADEQTLPTFLLGEPMVLGLDHDSLKRMVEVAQGSDGEAMFASVQVRGRFGN